MKTRVTETSLSAYQKVDKPTGKQKILEALKNRGASTYSEIVFYTGMKLPSVVGRINELMYDDQAIVKSGEKNGKTLYKLMGDNDMPEFRPVSLFDQLYSDIYFCTFVAFDKDAFVNDIERILVKYQKFVK